MDKHGRSGMVGGDIGRPEDIGQFFHGLAEHAFHATLGVVDPPLVDYVAELLVRSTKSEPLGPLPIDRLLEPLLPVGDPAECVADPGACIVDPDDPDFGTDPLPADELRLLAAVGRGHGEAPVERIGDSALFWIGLYPEAVRARGRGGQFSLAACRRVGKSAYLYASTRRPRGRATRELFEKLFHEFDVCVEGLGEVRRAWTRAG